VQIDFEAHRIRFLAPNAPDPDGEVLPLRIGRTGIHVPIRVNGGGQRWVRLDTGCASSLHWVEPRKPSRSGSAVTTVAFADAESPGARRSIHLGALRFPDVAVTFHSKETFPGESGLLGNGLLSSFSSVTIDTRSNRLILRQSHTEP
jgi:hypothetical protein